MQKTVTGLHLLKEGVHEGTCAGNVDGTNAIFCNVVLVRKSLDHHTSSLSSAAAAQQ